MKRKIPRVVNVIELENAPFKCAKDADAWARSHGIVGLMSNVDTAGKGEVAISVHSLNKMLSGSALEKSSTPALHFAALMRLRDSNFPSKAYSYEISNIEILRGTAAPVARPSNKISMDVGILLNGVCDVNGVPLLDVCEANRLFSRTAKGMNAERQRLRRLDRATGARTRSAADYRSSV